MSSTLAISWFLLPLLLAALAIGCGLLLEAVSGLRLPGPVVPVAGLAVIILAGQLTTATDATAELTTPLVVALAVAGLALRPPWRWDRIDPWAVAAAVAVYLVFAAPILFSGKPTFAGYIKLDDTATWLALTDRVMEHGRSLSGLAPSTYEATLAFNLASGYPIGVFIPLGIGHVVLGTDSAWLFQPYLSFLAAMLGLGLYSLAGELLDSRPARAVIAFVASQPALLFGYALWGGIKELGMAQGLALIAVLAVPIARGGGRIREVVPLAVASASAVAMIAGGAGFWLVPLLVATLALAVARIGWARAGRQALAFGALATVFSVPFLLTAGLVPPTSLPLTSGAGKGNLIHPLSIAQLIGIWPVGDFRVDPGSIGLTGFLIGIATAAGLAGIVLAARRRAYGPLLYVGAAVVGGVAGFAIGSPWAGGKAMTISSAGPLLAALLGAVLLAQAREFAAWQIMGWLVAIAVAGGVLWGTALAYHEANLAPYDRLHELELIGKRIKGQGPTLMTDYETYGVRHFLRDADPEAASELRRRVVSLVKGGSLRKGETADIDAFRLDGLLPYRTLVLRTSPVGSRPPSLWDLGSSGRYYDVWQRNTSPPPLAHIGLGSNVDPEATPRCSEVLGLAKTAGVKHLAVATHPPATVVNLGEGSLPAGWTGDDANRSIVYPNSSGAVQITTQIARPGRYTLWLGGGYRGGVKVLVDGRPAGASPNQLNETAQYDPLGEVTLGRGPHSIVLDYSAGGLRPGAGGQIFAIGPIVLSPAGARDSITYIPPAKARSLCKGLYDWIEALR